MSQDNKIPAVSATEYVPPSVSAHLDDLYKGASYTHYTPIPPSISPNGPSNPGTPCTLGIDEAGRGPVIGPMVYGLFYLPVELHHSLLSTTHSFNDSKVLTPLFRAQLMQKLCTPPSDLFTSCGWAIKSLSARDISAGMLRASGSYNLNAQAMDATVEIIREVLDRGVNVVEIYIDTIGQPAAYQRKLEKIFPTVKITVEKKADSLFPVVSAASVVAKVTRDVSCEVLYRRILADKQMEEKDEDLVMVNGVDEVGWGSGYPSDAKCVSWMKGSMDPMFGWGSECRFSWGTVKDLLEGPQKGAVQVDWPDDEVDGNGLSQYFAGSVGGVKGEGDEFRGWYGSSVKSIF